MVDQKLFNYMKENFNVLLLESEAREIERIILKNKKCDCSELSVVNMNLKVLHLKNDVYQVVDEKANTIWYQGTLEECNDWLMS